MKFRCLKALVDLKLVLNVEESLEDLLLLSLADFVLFSPPSIQLLVEGIHFILLLCQHVVHLNLKFVTPLLLKLGSFLLMQCHYRGSHSLSFWVAKT